MINKIATLIFIALFASACSQADTSSSNQAESKKEEQKVTNLPSNSAALANKTTDILDIVAEKAPTESPNTEAETEDVEVNSENIENPVPVKQAKPVQVNQKIEPKKKVDVAKDKLAESATIPPKAPVKEEIAAVIETQKESIKETVAEEKPPVVEEVKEVVAAFSHDAFNQLLKKHVSAKGNVNYGKFKADESKLDAYLKGLDENPPASGWSKSKKMAYWINAYNAGTIKLILKNYPTSSITKLHGGKPWDQKWIPLGGKTYSLNNIENDILRPIYKDARIHFAVNCAAKSCPPLLNRAWTEGNLNRYLAQQTKAFVNDASQNKISADAIEISKIFEWYAVDFGNLIDFLNQYSNVKINPGAKVTYKEYNWDLNK